MSWTILRSSLQLRRMSLFWYSLGIALYGWMMIAFFPLIAENLEYMEAVEDMFTEELLAVFGGAGLDFTTLGGFIGVEYLSLIWVLIVGAAVITFAGSALGGAVDDGTMELTLAQPVSRMQVAVTRYVTMAAYAAVLNFVTVATLYVPGLLHDVDVPLDAMGLLFLVGWLLTMAIGGFAYMLSALSSGSGRAIGISLGVLVAMWLADVLGNISDKAEWLVNLSLFHYWRPHEVIDDVSVAAETWAIFGLSAAVFFTIAILAFQRRDVV